jgi:hypothetical protein
MPGQPAFDAREGVAAATLASDLKRFFRGAARSHGREDPKAQARFCVTSEPRRCYREMARFAQGKDAASSAR